MISVSLTTNDGKTELCRIEIEKLDLGDPDYCDYTVRFIVDRAAGVTGIHQRGITGFPRKKYNALALLTQALALLEEEDLKLDGSDFSANMAWRFSDGVPEIQAW